MKKYFFQLLFFALFVIIKPLKGQNDSVVATTDNIQFKLGTYYNSNLHYYGRTDSLRSSAVFPVAEIWIKGHFYINAAPVFVNNAVSSFEYAGSVVTAGYYFRNSKWAGNTFITKPIYKESVKLVQSALQWQAATSFSRLGKLLNLSMGADIKYSDKIDYGATAAIDHLFRKQVGGKSVLVINPTLTMNMGTQHFTQTSYKQTGILNLPGSQQTVTEEVNRFVVLSYEITAPVVFAKGKFQLIVIPAYVVPQNLVVVPDRPDLSERGRNLFNMTAGLKLVL
jgi:hypothetical protein